MFSRYAAAGKSTIHPSATAVAASSFPRSRRPSRNAVGFGSIAKRAPQLTVARQLGLLQVLDVRPGFQVTRLFVHQITDQQERAGVPGAVVEAFWSVDLLVALAKDFLIVRLVGVDFQFYLVDRVGEIRADGE